LAQLLSRERGARNHLAVRRLTPTVILQWADSHHRRTGVWPKSNSGKVLDAPGETWQAINLALWRGTRGLTGNDSLPRLLERKRGVANNLNRPKLTNSKILAWAKAHFRRTGRWPNKTSGAILDAAGETWGAMHQSLRLGLRGLPGNTTLAQLLAKFKSPQP
jgi:hypothetical protein